MQSVPKSDTISSLSYVSHHLTVKSLFDTCKQVKTMIIISLPHNDPSNGSMG